MNHVANTYTINGLPLQPAAGCMPRGAAALAAVGSIVIAVYPSGGAATGFRCWCWSVTGCDSRAAAGYQAPRGAAPSSQRHLTSTGSQ